MKKIVFILSAIIAFSPVFAQVQPVNLEIKSGKFFINGGDLDNWEVAPVVELLGKSPKVSKKSNNIHLYDSLGLSLYEEIVDDLPNDRLVEIHLFFDPAKVKWETPSKQKFAGKFTIDGFTITSKISYAQLKAQEAKAQFTKSYKPHSYFFDKDGITYFFDFNDAETALVKVSLGKARE